MIHSSRDYLSEKVGVKLSTEKTQIIHVSGGFDFLGFHLRKIDGRLIIKPKKENVADFRYSIKQATKTIDNPTKLIATLNPIITGWGNYYRHVCSKRVFSSCDNYLWHRLYAWRRLKHPYRSNEWTAKRYFKKIDNDNWRFYDTDSGLTLKNMFEIKIRRFIKVRVGKRVYNSEDKEYWTDREQMFAQQVVMGKIYNALYKKQQGNCAYCDRLFAESEVKSQQMHLHHMMPKSSPEVYWKLNNLRLLHVECHREIHRQFSNSEMERYINSQIDYIILSKSRHHS